ncbi:MAG: flagellar basal body rod modification protein, partial [Cyclobacteriaceae bacterium]|nr:flagellar basal body rod modification protein [Cyclobacteriaceae bacterium]
EVFLATVGAIFRSIDGGNSWNVVLGRKANSTPDTDLNNSNLSDFSDIVQTVDGIYYAVLSQRSRSGSSTHRGIYRSEDGVTWIKITPGIWPQLYARTVIATSKMNPNEVYFSVNSQNEMLWRYTYISENGSGSGGRWEDLSDNIPAYGGEVGDYDSQDSYNMVLNVHPANEDVVFLGGTNLYRSTDGFSTIENTAWIGGYDTANNIKVFPNHFVDQHALAFYPSNPNKMISSNDGGVFMTDDNSSDNIFWAPLNKGFVTTQFYTLGIDEFGSKGAIMGGLQDNGTLIANKPIDVSSWNVLLAGDGGYSAITKNESYYYASFQFGNIYRFTLDKNHQSQSFTRIDPAESGGEGKLLFVNPYILAPENQNVMYFAGGDVVWRNSNTSQVPLYKNYASDVNWQRMSFTEFSNGTITVINTSYNPSGYVFYGTNTGRVFRINNANEVEYSVDEITSPSFTQNAYVPSIAIDRKDSKNILISFSNYNVISLFYTRDGGQTFENISGNLEENADGSGAGPSVRWAEIVSKNDGLSQYFVGTSAGIYSTKELNGITTVWEREGSETVGNVVVTMLKYFSE